MNSPEAQFILTACRPGHADAEDARVSEALALAQDDPQLAAWWEDQQAFDAALVGKLKDVPPPPELALQLRAGRRVAVESPPAPRFRWRPVWLAIAAAIVLTLVLVQFLPVRPSQPATVAFFRQQMADYLAQRWDHRLDASPDSYAKIEQWLAAQTAPVPEDLPVRLVSQPTYGCKVIEWRGTKATLICFNVRDAYTTVHLLVVDSAAVRDAAPETQFTDAGRWSSATWSRHGKTYVALCEGSRAALEKVLQPGA